ncbi:DUF4184 family protein [Microbacterium flavum]|uniref:DUF4184 family protein n=1 Tax=Microbacterium flavum TaxID=415216 RepID=A0ABS5XR19_9MICO|nr:DUF4184 family protein [Microbacterium flavum]MBT8796965.1 DUF4184 family protein [Microbacterium flavum]
MPFTPSHAVVALPFVRTPLLPAAIAIGSMTPDLPLFLRGTPLSYQVTHTNVAVSSLVALVLLALWYLLLRPAVRELTPRPIARRLPPQWDATGAAAVRGVLPGRSAPLAALWIAASLILGVVTHIVWDAFTHEGRAGVSAIPALDERWGPLLGYKWVQYASGVLGLLMLAVAGILWLRKRPRASFSPSLPSWVRPAWWASLPAFLIAAWVLGAAARGPFTAEWTPQHLAYLVLPPACALWGLLTVIVCIVVQVRRRGAEDPTPTTREA